MNDDEQDDEMEDPILIRRRQLKARSRKRLMFSLIGCAAILVLISVGAIVGLALKRTAASSGKANSSKQAHNDLPGKTVEGEVDLVTMDMMDFLNAGSKMPHENKAVIVLKRRNQVDVYCYFPPESGSDQTLLAVRRGDRMIVSGRLKAETTLMTAMVNCKVVAHFR